MPILEPPKITNRPLFQATGDPGRDVVIGTGHPDWYRFAYGYKVAAAKLVAHLTGHGMALESACRPILFLYRHSVELMLKALLIDLGELTDSPEATSDKHPLSPLWERVRERVLAYDPRQDSPWLDRAEFLIAELDRLDRGSFSFRYPVGKNGLPLVAFGETISIEHFADVMQELWLVLDGTAAMLDEHIQLKRDMESEFEDGYGLYY